MSLRFRSIWRHIRVGEPLEHQWPWNEVPGAMQQGVIDGLDNPPNVMYAFKFYETAKYFTEIRYALLSATLVMGEENSKNNPKKFRKPSFVQAKQQ